MNKEERTRLEVLRTVYEKSQWVCDPLVNLVRQHNLLKAIAECLLEPLIEIERK